MDQAGIVDPLISIFESARAKFDRITDWINQMKPPRAADVGRASLRRSRRSRRYYPRFGKNGPSSSRQDARYQDTRLPSSP